MLHVSGVGVHVRVQCVGADFSLFFLRSTCTLSLPPPPPLLHRHQYKSLVVRTGSEQSTSPIRPVPRPASAGLSPTRPMADLGSVHLSHSPSRDRDALGRHVQSAIENIAMHADRFTKSIDEAIALEAAIAAKQGRSPASAGPGIGTGSGAAVVGPTVGPTAPRAGDGKDGAATGTSQPLMQSLSRAMSQLQQQTDALRRVQPSSSSSSSLPSSTSPQARLAATSPGRVNGAAASQPGAASAGSPPRAVTKPLSSSQRVSVPARVPKPCSRRCSSACYLCTCVCVEYSPFVQCGGILESAHASVTCRGGLPFSAPPAACVTAIAAIAICVQQNITGQIQARVGVRHAHPAWQRRLVVIAVASSPG